MNKYEFWFIVGSQFLYGPETLAQVEENSLKMASALNESGKLPCSASFKGIMKTADEITAIVREANHCETCAGIIVFMHTFSPSKMWINGLVNLQKPYLHFHTQFNQSIPNEAIDMDYMNLHQSAHGDREHGFIAARLRLARKVVAGYWQDSAVQEQVGSWMKSALGVMESKGLKVMRFGDNMREVAVTEGDKIEAQIKLGWQVNTWPVGALSEAIDAVTEAQVDALIEEYKNKYQIKTDNLEAVRYQAREEIAIKQMLDSQGCKAFSNTFQDLYGMKQLPGLASQRLMEMGYGYAGEGDWKTAALTRIVKAIAGNGTKGTSFMEDYTYDLTPGAPSSLGAHMLEVCPSIAADKPRIEVHHLGIGDKEPPARLVFEGKAGKAILSTLIDMGGRFRLIVHDIECIKPILDMPNLPVARVMWRPAPDLNTGSTLWITAGGAHHAVLSYDVTAEQMMDWARMMQIECVHITNDSTIEGIEQQLFLSDLAWKLR